MAYGRILIRDQNDKTDHKHEITEIDHVARTIETAAVTLKKIRIDCTRTTLASTVTWIKAWNGVPASVNTVAPDFMWPCSLIKKEPHEFNIEGVFTDGLTIIATSTKANGNTGASKTQAAPQATGPADTTIDIQVYTKLET